MNLKNIFKFLTAFVLAICAFAFMAEASPPTMANPANNMQKNMRTLLIGTDGIGTTALSRIIAEHPNVVIVAHSDCDGTDRLTGETPLIANKLGAIPMATAERIYQLTEPEKPKPSVAAHQSPPTIYRMSPDINRYSGQRVDNLIRADTRSNL